MKNQKRIIAAVSAVAALAAIIAAICIFSAVKNSVKPLEKSGVAHEDINLVSHRGFSHLAPENTLEAAQKAADNGYRHIEFDIRRTKDGVWVLMHDSNIKRTTDGKGEINQLTYKQILSFKIDEGKALDEHGLVVVPTLKDMLSLCNYLNLRPVIEIKESGTDHLLELLHEIALCRSGNFDIISFSKEQIEEIDSILKQGKTALYRSNVNLYWLVSELDEETVDAALENTSTGISFSCGAKKIAERIKPLQEADIPLAVWTVNSPKQLKELYDLGIRTFTTDKITPYDIKTQDKSEHS